MNMNSCAAKFAWLSACVMVVCLVASVRADDPVFSGPQPGEKLPALKMRGVLEPSAGQEIELVTEEKQSPIVLIFVHQVSRPSIGFTRTLSAYTLTRRKDELRTGIVWLDDDASKAEATVLRVKHALTSGVPTGVSLDGGEGPGSYGLNRNVALTILVAKDNNVTANFALVQPSLQADLPKVLEAIVAVIGGEVPKLSELEGMPEMARAREGGETNDSAKANEMLRPLLRPLIQKDATADQVKEAAAALEKAIVDKPLLKRELIQIARRIVSSGKLSNYGTAEAQDFLLRWSKIDLEKNADANTETKGSPK